MINNKYLIIIFIIFLIIILLFIFNYLLRDNSTKFVIYKAWKNEDLEENFADGKNPGRKGLAKRSGVDCKQSVTKLRSIAAHSSGEKQRMAHWCANMKSGHKK